LLTRVASALVVAGLLLVAGPAAAALRVNGSTTVNPVVSEAAAILRAEEGLDIQIDTAGGSSGGIAALADGRADVAMSSRPLAEHDRERFPAVDFRAVLIGSDALALVVSRDVWEGGVRCLGREQIRALYEGEVRNWRDLGGPDQRVVFFNKEPGRGTWEVFVNWLYGSADAAPLVSLPEVGSNEEARSKVASSRGAVTQLSAAWADGETTVALSICTAAGAIAATAANVEAGRYPLARPLFVITDGSPSPVAAKLIEFIRGPRGQSLVVRHGYLPLAAASVGASP
jgi:phosphate transport system substrate-binding protein